MLRAVKALFGDYFLQNWEFHTKPELNKSYLLKCLYFFIYAKILKIISLTHLSFVFLGGFFVLVSLLLYSSLLCFSCVLIVISVGNLLNSFKLMFVFGQFIFICCVKSWKHWKCSTWTIYSTQNKSVQQSVL